MAIPYPFDFYYHLKLFNDRGTSSVSYTHNHFTTLRNTIYASRTMVYEGESDTSRINFQKTDSSWSSNYETLYREGTLYNLLESVTIETSPSFPGFNFIGHTHTKITSATSAVDSTSTSYLLGTGEDAGRLQRDIMVYQKTGIVKLKLDSSKYTISNFSGLTGVGGTANEMIFNLVEGATFTMKCTPKTGYIFVHWKITEHPLTSAGDDIKTEDTFDTWYLTNQNLSTSTFSSGRGVVIEPFVSTSPTKCTITLIGDPGAMVKFAGAPSSSHSTSAEVYVGETLSLECYLEGWYEWAGWENSATGEVVMDYDFSYTVTGTTTWTAHTTLDPRYVRTVTTRNPPNGGGYVEVSCGGYPTRTTQGMTSDLVYSVGYRDKVTLRARNLQGWTFTGWIESNTTGYWSTSQSITVEITDNVDFTPVFTQNPPDTVVFTFESNNPIYGTVSVSELSEIPYGTEYTVSNEGGYISVSGITDVVANPSPNTDTKRYTFDGWSISDGVYNATADTVITASFSVSSTPTPEPPDIPDPEPDTDAIQPGGNSVKGTNYLARYNSTDSGGAFLNIPNIKSIEETDSTQLTEVSTIIYGYDRNFIMDTGTTEKLSITFTRVQPDVVVDKVGGEYDTNLDNQHKWSNGHWFAMLKKFTNVWQNLTYSSNGLRKGGFTFHFEPLEGCEDLYPIIDRNVFISGSVSASFSSNLQNMEVTLPLAVGSMVRTETQGVGDHRVTYYNGPPSEDSYTLTYPSGMSFPTPYPKKSWLQKMELKKFKFWRSITPPMVYDAGSFVVNGENDEFIIDDVTNLKAEWDDPINNTVYICSRGSRNIYFTQDDVPAGVTPAPENILNDRPTRIKMWTIGGGGAGGRGRILFFPGSSFEEYLGGGGGGSGGFNIEEAVLGSTNEIYYNMVKMVVGEGGDKDSVSGKSSYVELVSYTLNPDTHEQVDESESIRKCIATGGSPGAKASLSGTTNGGKGGSPNGGKGESGGATWGRGGYVPELLVDGGYYVGNTLINSTVGKGGNGDQNLQWQSDEEGNRGIVLVAFYR